MQDKTCVIFDFDEEYAGGLVKSLNTIINMRMNIMIFTKEDELLQFVRENKVFLFIADEELLSEGIWDQIQSYEKNNRNKDRKHELCEDLFQGSEKVVLLSAERADESLDDKYKRVFKYQAVDCICKEIMELCREKDNTNEIRCDFTGVYSPISNCYKTVFSLALAQALGENQKVLYVNLEEFSGLGEILGQQQGNLSDAIYYYRTGRTGRFDKIRSLIVNMDRFDYIPPVNCFEDINFISVEQWMDFFTELSENTSYDCVVLDISNGINKPWKLAQFCKRVYMPVKKDYISVKKVNEFERGCLSAGMEELIEKTEKIVVPYDESIKMGCGLLRQTEYGLLGAFVRGLIANE